MLRGGGADAPQPMSTAASVPAPISRHPSATRRPLTGSKRYGRNVPCSIASAQRNSVGNTLRLNLAGLGDLTLATQAMTPREYLQESARTPRLTDPELMFAKEVFLGLSQNDSRPAQFDGVHEMLVKLKMLVTERELEQLLPVEMLAGPGAIDLRAFLDCYAALLKRKRGIDARTRECAYSFQHFGGGGAPAGRDGLLSKAHIEDELSRQFGVSVKLDDYLETDAPPVPTPDPKLGAKIVASAAPRDEQLYVSMHAWEAFLIGESANPHLRSREARATSLVRARPPAPTVNVMTLAYAEMKDERAC